MKDIDKLRQYGQALVSTLTEPEENGFAIPSKVLQQHIAILGKTGSGKTYTAKGIAERLLAQRQRVCILDPTGVWWGLRSDTTGKKPAFPIYVLGGEHADLQLDSHAGGAIAEIIGTTDTSAVIDTRIFTISERTRFFSDFAETLLRRNRGPLSVIIDEAHLFVPQGRVSDPQSARMLHAGNNLVSLGRGVGLRITLISQRPAKLHKDSLTQAETLIALRLIAPQDRNAIEDWIGEWADPKQGRELLSSLASLPTGTGWVWAPEIGLLENMTFPRITTYDSSRAPDGSSRQIVLANIDLASIEQRLQSVRKDVEENDPKKLRARVKELERQVSTAVGIAKLEERIKTVEKPVMTAEDFDKFGSCIVSVRTAVADLGRIVDGLVSAVTQHPFSVISKASNDPLPVSARPTKQAGPILLGKPSAADPNSIGKSGLRRMLVALAQNPSGLTDSKLGLRADVSVKGGSFDTYLSKARQSGWVDGARQALRITHAGLDALGRYEPLPKGRALLDHWIAKLGTGGASRMLDVLARFYPKSLTAEELGQHAGVSVAGGSFDTYLSRLRGFDLITGKRSELRASEEFFL